jgi:hypothetical protein
LGIHLPNGIGSRPVVDLIATNNPAAAIPGGWESWFMARRPSLARARVLPNFNEFASEALISVTRKLQVRKAGSTITQTNQVFTMEVQVPTGVEFWNSYATNFPDAVFIAVTNFTSMTMTNDLGVNFTRSFRHRSEHQSPREHLAVLSRAYSARS